MKVDKKRSGESQNLLATRTARVYVWIVENWLGFATKDGRKCGASSTANCIPKQTPSFSYVWNGSNSTHRIIGQTLMESRVWHNSSNVGTHSTRGETILVFTWQCLAVIRCTPFSLLQWYPTDAYNDAYVLTLKSSLELFRQPLLWV